MKINLLLACVLALPISLFGQRNDEFKVDSLRLTRQYQPSLAEAVKFQLKPELPQFDAERPKFQYKPAQNLNPGDFKPNPVGLSKALIDPELRSKSNRITVGYGSYNSPLIGLNLNTINNKNWDLSLNGRHFSSSGSVERDGVTFRNVNYSETYAGISGHLFAKDWRYAGSIAYDRQSVRYYGVDSTDVAGFSGVAPEPTAQHYNLFTFQANASKQPIDSLGKNFNVSLLSHLLNDKLGQAEQQFQLKANGRIVFADQLIDWNVRYFFSNYQGLTNGMTRNLFEVAPRYILGDKSWQAGLGLKMVYVGDSLENKLRLFPDVYFNWKSADQNTSLRLIFQGDVQVNTFFGLVAQSPFVGVDPRLLNSPQIELKLSGSQRLGSSSVVSASLGYLRRDNWIFFKNEGPQLMPEYDPTTAQFSADVRYHWQLNDDWMLESGIRYRHLILDTIQAAWQTPRWLIDAKIRYRIQEKWHLNLEAAALEGITALNLSDQKVTFPWLIDLSSQLTYTYNKKTKIFLQVMNLASMRYIRWYNYPSYGLQVLAGLSLQL